MRLPEIFPNYGNEVVELSLEGLFNPKEFADGVTAFVGLITGVSESVVPNARDSDWTITVEQGSMLIQASANPSIYGSYQTVQKVTPIIYQGLIQLESDVKDENHSQYIFGKRVLKYVRKLADLANKDSGKTVSVKSDGKNVLFSPIIAEKARHLLGPKKAHSAVGHVEGQLTTLKGRSGFKMVVHRSFDGLPVQCITNDADLETQALNAFMKRVSVQGVVNYNNRGLPTSITAKKIKVFRSESELIPVTEIKGVLNE